MCNGLSVKDISFAEHRVLLFSISNERSLHSRTNQPKTHKKQVHFLITAWRSPMGTHYLVHPALDRPERPYVYKKCTQSLNWQATEKWHTTTMWRSCCDDLAPHACNWWDLFIRTWVADSVAQSSHTPPTREGFVSLKSRRLWRSVW